MKQVILLITALTINGASFAAFSKNSAELQALSASWKNQQSAEPKQLQHDMAIVYGGADIAKAKARAISLTG